MSSHPFRQLPDDVFGTRYECMDCGAINVRDLHAHNRVCETVLPHPYMLPEPRFYRWRRLFREGFHSAWHPRWKPFLWCSVGAFIGFAGRAW